MFWPLQFFGGGRLEILDRHYKTWPSPDHRAKFRVDRWTHLGDLALTKKSAVKHKSTPQAIASRQTNNLQYIWHMPSLLPK